MRLWLDADPFHLWGVRSQYLDQAKQFAGSEAESHYTCMLFALQFAPVLDGGPSTIPCCVQCIRLLNCCNINYTTDLPGSVCRAVGCGRPWVRFTALVSLEFLNFTIKYCKISLVWWALAVIGYHSTVKDAPSNDSSFHCDYVFQY